jgi:DNA polymerase-1
MVTTICDIETERLKNPEKVWVAVCKEVESGQRQVFYPYKDGFGPLADYLGRSDVVVGHNWLGFDGPVLDRLGGINTPNVIDTLVVSRLLNFNQPGGHSLDAWGERLNLPKLDFKQFDEYSEEMEEYCIRDVELTYEIYKRFEPYLGHDQWQKPLRLEHEIASLCNTISSNGFHFDIDGAKALLREYNILLSSLDEALAEGFPPKYVPLREITPKATKFGTLHKGDFRWVEDGDLSCFSVGAPFTRIEQKPFNPGSPKDIVDRLNKAGWKPTDKTKGHVDLLKKLSQKISDPSVTPEKIAHYEEFGWKVSEENLATLPETAPPACKSLVQRLTLASRISDLEEWIGCYEPSTGRIHGNFSHIGSWTHRMSHNHPNMANIPGVIELDENSLELDRYKAPLNRALRGLWGVPQDRFLVGCDADSIQLRAFAHYIDDEEFTYSLLQGNKKDKTDPHSVNQRALGNICKTRAHAKTFIYSFLMGAGVPKLAQVLECTTKEAGEAKENFMLRYPKYAHWRNVQTPKDAEQGYFLGLDGRQVVVQDKHKVISGYLQNFEVVIMKTAVMRWVRQLERDDIPFKLVNFVHDEWQTEVPRDRSLALYVAEVQAQAIKEAGELLQVRCPQAGSFRIGHNWYDTH